MREWRREREGTGSERPSPDSGQGPPMWGTMRHLLRGVRRSKPRRVAEKRAREVVKKESSGRRVRALEKVASAARSSGNSAASSAACSRAHRECNRQSEGEHCTHARGQGTASTHRSLAPADRRLSRLPLLLLAPPHAVHDPRLERRVLPDARHEVLARNLERRLDNGQVLDAVRPRGEVRVRVEREAAPEVAADPVAVQGVRGSASEWRRGRRERKGERGTDQGCEHMSASESLLPTR